MALEQVFDCPRTVRGLRSGPLGSLLEGFVIGWRNVALAGQRLGNTSRTYPISANIWPA